MSFSLGKKIIAVTMSLCITIVSYLPMFANESAMKKIQEIKVMLSPYFSEIVDTRGMSEINRKNANSNELSFTMKDGSTTVYTFGEPVRFIDSTGTLKTKDISITGQKDAALQQQGYAFANGDNDYRLNFSPDPSKGVLAQYEGISFSLAPVAESDSCGEKITEDRNGEPTDVFLYPNVFGQGTALKYYPQFNGVKDDIVLERYNGKNRFDFTLRTYGCKAELTEDNTILITDKNSGEIVQVFSPLFAYDAEGNEFSQDEHYTDDCSYELKEISEQEYRLTVVVSEEFLTAPTTVYPVTVDPVTGNIANSMDTPIHSKRTTTGAYVDANVVGDSTALGTSRSLVKFNLPTEIQAGAHVVTGAWSNNTLWSNQPSYNASAMDRKNINSNSTDGGPNVYWYKFNITGAVNAWTHGTANNGILLKSESEGTATMYQRSFAQLEYTTSGYRPYTIINYTNDTTGPTVSSVSGNPAAWTKNDVVLTVNGASDSSGLHAQPYSFSAAQGQYSWQTSASKTFAANQTVYIYTRDALGNIALGSTVTINKIDKTVPAITNVAVAPSSWSNTNGSITVTATDTGSGISGYSFDNGATWQTASTKTYTQNTYGIIVKVKDSAGNITAISAPIDITKIDKVAPASPQLYEENGLVYLYDSDKIEYDSEFIADTISMEYKIGENGTWKAYNYTLGIEIPRNQNITVYARAYDIAGNCSAVSSKQFVDEHGYYVSLRWTPRCSRTRYHSVWPVSIRLATDGISRLIRRLMLPEFPLPR